MSVPTIVDHKNIALYREVSNSEMRLDYCELCGATAGYFETHHIKSEGSGGTNRRGNKINLCVKCHTKAQEYIIKPYQLIVSVARRENAKVSEVYQAIGWAVPDEIAELEEIKLNTEYSLKTVEDLINSLQVSGQQVEDMKFFWGETINELVKRKVSISYIASEWGVSPSTIRIYLKTYQAFPDEESRAANLNFTHHRIAANTDSPQEWIEIAAAGTESKEILSTRDLNAAIKEKDLEEGKVPAEDNVAHHKKRAKHALSEIEEIISFGGENAEWLRKEILNLVNELCPLGERKQVLAS